MAWQMRGSGLYQLKYKWKRNSKRIYFIYTFERVMNVEDTKYNTNTIQNIIFGFKVEGTMKFSKVNDGMVTCLHQFQRPSDVPSIPLKTYKPNELHTMQ